MPVVIPESAGYEGTVDEPQWSDLLSMAGGRQYGVADAGSWKVTVGTADREVRIAPGRGFGYGVRDRSTTVASLTLPATTSGSRWHLIVVERDWAANQSAFDSVAGSDVRALPPRDNTPGVNDAQPLALARVDAGQSQVAEIIDLRVWGGDGGSFANDELVLQYLNRIGTQLQIGARSWMRGINTLGQPEWRDLAAGRLLGVYPLQWFGLAPSGSLPGQGVNVWGNQTQTIARYNLPDPGSPYRVRMYSHGFWGSEFQNAGNRHDFDMMVGSTAIATWLPPGDDFYFGNWRSWSPPASEAVFTGPQQLGFRARRIYGNPYGAVRQADSVVIAEVFSA
jgi:hypothetical protein